MFMCFLSQNIEEKSVKSFLSQLKLWKKQIFDRKWNSYNPRPICLIQGSTFSYASDKFSAVNDFVEINVKKFP